MSDEDVKKVLVQTGKADYISDEEHDEDYLDELREKWRNAIAEADLEGEEFDEEAFLINEGFELVTDSDEVESEVHDITLM